MIAWGHFYIILLHYPLCHKGDIIYRYVSLHHSLEIWVFLTLGKLTRSIFIENSMKSIIYGPSLQATWKPHQKMPNMVLMFLQCLKCMELPLFKSMVLFFLWDALVSSSIFIPLFHFSFVCISLLVLFMQAQRVRHFVL
mgnify:CR=1 FL=1